MPFILAQFSCDDHSASATGWFTNPGFPTPSTTRLSCTLTLDKTSEDIQQIRLDFVNFEVLTYYRCKILCLSDINYERQIISSVCYSSQLLPPNVGTCEQDQFVVSGQNVNNIIPIFCGVNTGQHSKNSTIVC